MRNSQVSVTTFFLALLAASFASAGVGPGSNHAEDALRMSEGLADYLGVEPMVSLTGPDSAAVVFVAMGGEWSGDTVQWDQLLLISSFAVYLDMLSDWDLLDIAVSFGDTWCRIPCRDLLPLVGSVNDEDDPAAAFESIVEIRQMGAGNL